MQAIDQEPTSGSTVSKFHQINRPHLDNQGDFPQYLLRLCQWFGSSPLFRRRAMIAVSIFVMMAFSFIALSSLWISGMQRVSRVGLNRRHLPHLNNYLTSFEQYLLRYDMNSLLQIKCRLQCLKDQKQSSMKSIQIHYADAWPDSINLEGDYYDWLNFNDMDLMNMGELKVEAFAKAIKQSSRVGLSFMWSIEQFSTFEIQNLQWFRSVLSRHGLIYNKVLSLNLRRLEGKAIQIFTPLGSKADIVNNSSMMAIHSEITLNQDLPFLREWLGYHVYLGINLFFLYEAKGDSLASCIDVPEHEVLNEWWKVLKQYSSYVVFIPWSPPTERTWWHKLLGMETNTRHDYSYYYRNAAQYTIFLNPSEIIFSPIGIKLSISIADNERNNGNNHFVLETKRFVHRMCGSSSALLKVYQYFNEDKESRELKQIFKTWNYRPGWGVGFDHVVNKRTYRFSSTEWRVNTYTLTVQEIKNIQSRMRYPHFYLSYDFSSESRSTITEGLCYDKCLIKVTPECLKRNNIECPKPIAKLAVDNISPLFR